MGQSALRWQVDRDVSQTGWTITGQRLSAGRHEQVLSVVLRTAELLGWETAPAPLLLADQQCARATLAEAWQGVTEALSASHEPAGVAVLVELARDIRGAEDGVREDQAVRQSSTTQVVRDALSALRDVRSVDELVRRAPAAAASIGFDRVLLSRIEESTWVPERMYVARDEQWADEILQAGREQLRTLDSSLLETQIVRRNKPLVVADTDRPNLHRALVDATRTRSYAAAPIVGWGRVIGFLHADCFQERRHLDAVDRDQLWMFCDGLGHLITRTAAMDAVESLRGELDRLVAGMRSFDALTGWPPPATPCAAAEPPGAARPVSSGWSGSPGRTREFTDEVEGVLTRREVEVMRLMGAGHTNAQIARRLVISEGTVKSHVKHILRKLGAANRAEAVSRWLREEHARHDRAGQGRQAARMGA